MKKKVDAVTSRIRAVKQRMSGSPNFNNLDSIYRDGDYRKAVFIAQDIVAAHPASREAKYKLALALSRNSQLLRAEEILKSIIPDGDSDGQTERRYLRALEVVRTKIAVAEKWVEKSTGSPLRTPAHAPAVGERKFPAWLLLARLQKESSRASSDYFRTAAELLMDMHSWSLAAEQYRNLVLTGKSAQKDLRNYAKCLIRDGQDQLLEGVLAELNNMRTRAKQAVLTISDLAASVGEYEFAAKGLNVGILDGLSDYTELDKAQLRLRRAGRLSEAFHVGKVIATIQHRDKLALRTGLYAEQLGLKREAMKQYDSVVAASPTVPSVASLRLARLVAEDGGDEAAIHCLTLAYGHWGEFDQENRLFDELAHLLKMNESRGKSEWGEKSDLTSELRTCNGSDSEISSDGGNASDPATTLIDRVRARLSRSDGSAQIEAGAYASRELRRARSLSYLADGSSSAAIHEAQKVVFSADNFVPSDLVFLAYILARAGQFSDANYALSASEENSDPFRYQASRPGDRHRHVFRYLTLRTELPLFDHVFLWESHFGSRVDCNPYAMWQEVCKRDTAGEYLHIWVCNDPSNAPADVLANKQTVVTKRESAGYWFALAVAKYLVNNASFSHEFLKRHEQVHVNTWHGTPLKGLGRDDHDSPYDYGNVSRNIIHSSDLVMPSKFTADIFLNRYSVGSLCPAQVHIVGQARNDRLVNMSTADRLAIRQSLGIGAEDTFVFYAPTWRGGSKNSWFDVARLEQDLLALGGIEDCIVGFRGHPLAMKYLDNLRGDVLVPDPAISTYDMLSIADVLVTDYSSLGIDFLCRERPVVYYVHDYDEYSATRGLYFSRNEFPGYVVDNIDGLLDAVRLAKTDQLLSSTHMKQLRDTFAPLDDGEASSRAVDALLASTGTQLGGHMSDRESSPVLFTHDLASRDSIEAFVRTANTLAESGRSIVVVFNQSSVVSDPGLVEVLDLLSPDIHVLPRKGMFVQTVSEFSASEQFLLNDEMVDVEDSNPYLEALEREASRLFGSIRFSLAVAWGADDVVLTGLCAYGVTAEQRIAYLDTDVSDVWTRCFPSRKRATQLFPGFDEILVSNVKSRDWIRDHKSVQNVRYAERSFSGLSSSRNSGFGLPEDSIVMVGSDSDWNLLDSAIAALSKCTKTLNKESGGIVVYVQGPAREGVADMLRQDNAMGEQVDLRTEEFPYGGMSHPQLLVDCGGGEEPSVAMLDAVAAGVPVVNVAQILSSLGDECTHNNRLDALASVIEATWIKKSDGGRMAEQTVPNLATQFSEYMPR